MEEIPFEEVRITERGPWRASLALVARFGNSTAQITISLDSLPATVPAKERNARCEFGALCLLLPFFFFPSSAIEQRD